MDEIVLRAIARWPDVPNVFGWLSLDRRGNWLIKGARIANRGFIDFISRNYDHDGEGRWFFQNGPQRVFVALDYTPLVYRVRADGGPGLVLETHTGARVESVEGAWLDEGGNVLLKSGRGIGILLDRDLPEALRCLRNADGRPADEAALAAALEPGAACNGATGLALLCAGTLVPLARIHAAEVPLRFGYVSRPAPAPGEPEC